MIIKILTAGLLVALLLTANSNSFAKNEVQLYGRIDIAAESSNDSIDDTFDILSNASRIGIKGKSSIARDLDIVYQLEHAVHPIRSDERESTFTQRDSYLGIVGNYGSILVGEFDTPAKNAAGGIDLFSDLSGDFADIFFGENRTSDTLQYTTPNYKGVTFKVAGVCGGDGDSFAKPISTSVTYKRENFYLGLGLDDGVEERNLVRIATQYHLANHSLGAMYQQSEDLTEENVDGDGFFLSWAYRMKALTWKAQFGNSSEKGKEKVQYSVGVDYHLAKLTKLYFYITDLSDEHHADSHYVGIGVQHNFEFMGSK